MGMNLNTFGRIEELLADLNFFTGITDREIFAELDRDMKDFEIMYTLEDLLERVKIELISQGRTYDA